MRGWLLHSQRLRPSETQKSEYLQVLINNFLHPHQVIISNQNHLKNCWTKSLTWFLIFNTFPSSPFSWSICLICPSNHRQMKKNPGSKPRDFKPKDGAIGSRFEIPFHIKCVNCKQMWAKGVRFDSRKFKGNQIFDDDWDRNFNYSAPRLEVW